MRSAVLQVALLSVVVVPTFGCRGLEVPAEDALVTVVDSAGVEVVTNPAAALERVWRVLGEPVLEIGEVDEEGPYLFDRVFKGHRFDDGTIVVYQNGDRTLRYFDQEGRHLATAAGEGQGPSELRIAYDVWPVAEDEIEVLGLNKINRYGKDGTFLGTRPVDLASFIALGGENLAVGTIWPLSDGSWFSFAGEQRRSPPTSPTPDVYWPLRIPADLGSTDTLGVLEGGVAYPDGSGGTVWNAFPRSAWAAVGSDPSLIYMFDNRAWEVRQHDVTGRLVRLIRSDMPVAALTEADWEAWRGQQRAFGERNGDPARYERRIAATPDQDWFPFFGPSAPLVDRSGRLWVERRPHVGEPRRFWVVEPDGRLLGQVDVPERFIILDMTDTHLLGSWRNELDVEFVRLYELSPPSQEDPRP